MAYTTYALKDFIDNNGDKYQDIYLDQSGNIATLSDKDAIIQTVKTNIGLWLGEYIYNTAIGIDYRSILGDKLNEAFLYSELTNAATRVFGVLGIANINYKFNQQTRILTLTLYIKLKSGIEPVTVETASL